MSHSGVERRRVSRVPLEQSCQLSLVTSVPVQVVDISEAGLQLLSKFMLVNGDRGELCMTTGSGAVRLPVEIRRVTVEHNPRRGSRYCAGAVFGPMTIEHRGFLKEMLGVEPT
jgi:hypothetical protein